MTQFLKISLVSRLKRSRTEFRDLSRAYD